jgi:SP family facilitated glucose transporter-like MFS transporter 8
MAIREIKDVERGEIVNKVEDLGKPFLTHEDDEKESENNESYLMVLFSTFVAVCGSFEFGSCVSFCL